MRKVLFNAKVYVERGKFAEAVLVENDKIEFFEAKEISITSDRPLETDIDGDEGDKLPVDIKVLADHIEVYSPQN